MEEDRFQLTQIELDAAWNAGPLDYIGLITDAYLNTLDGQLTEYNMDALSADQHTLLAYRYILDEVMEGGFIQLIQIIRNAAGICQHTGTREEERSVLDFRFIVHDLDIEPVTTIDESCLKINMDIFKVLILTTLNRCDEGVRI